MSSLPAGSSFTKQINFRITLEDYPLLERVAVRHGGIQAGIIAALRLLDESAPASTPSGRDGSAELVPITDFADAVGVTPQTIRLWARSGRVTLRGDTVDILTVRLERAHAARLLGVTSQTLARRSSPLPDGEGLYQLTDLGLASDAGTA